MTAALFTPGQPVAFGQPDAKPSFRGRGIVRQAAQQTNGAWWYQIDERRFDDGWAASRPFWHPEHELTAIEETQPTETN